MFDAGCGLKMRCRQEEYLDYELQTPAHSLPRSPPSVPFDEPLQAVFDPGADIETRIARGYR